MIKKIGLVAVLAMGLAATAVFASHAWGNYHWARTSNPFTLKLGDNVSSNWDTYLSTASSDWSASSILDTTVVTGNLSKNCRPTAGRVEICNKKYGANGWLGLASVWVSGDHITQGTVKMNDTYFASPSYNNSGWKSLVMCQEIGHTLGLNHQDEDFNNTPINPHTCMDYFVPGVSEVVRPNQHDYDQLAAIYSHLDSFTTIKQTAPTGNHGDAAEWGKSIKNDGHGKSSVFEEDLGNGNKIFTFVFWTE